MTENYLTIESVCKSYGKGDAAQLVLDNVTLNVSEGERIAILGPSGCGKSTLLNLVSGIDRVDSGTISVNGIDLTSLAEKELTLFRRENIGFVYQSFNLIQTLTALENIQLPLQINGLSAGQTKDLSMQLLERVGLGRRASAFPDQLSGGEQQRVAIARAMVHSPALVLADEHTGNLDANTGREMIDLFNELAVSGNQTVLMVTHSMAIASTADRIVRFHQGRLATETDPDESSLAW